MQTSFDGDTQVSIEVLREILSLSITLLLGIFGFLCVSIGLVIPLFFSEKNFEGVIWGLLLAGVGGLVGVSSTHAYFSIGVRSHLLESISRTNGDTAIGHTESGVAQTADLEHEGARLHEPVTSDCAGQHHMRVQLNRR